MKVTSIAELALLALCVPATAADVKIWSIYEMSFTTSAGYKNPYLETGMTADFKGPKGQVVSVRGFWDGGRTFKVRWTPASAGQWTYSTRSSDPGLNGKSGEVRATAAAPGQHGFLRRDAANPYSFVFDDGSRYFLFGNTYYALVRNALQGDGWRTSVDNSRAIGMSKIRFYPTRVADDRYAAWKPETAEALNIEALRKADTVIGYLAGKGIVADVIVFQRPHVDLLNLEQAQRFLRYALARYGAYTNVIWCLQNEWQYTKHPKDFWTSLGRVAAAEDPWAKNEKNVRGLSVHQQTRPDWEMFGENWYSHVIVQLGVRNRGKAARGGDEWKLPPGKRSVMPYGDDWGNFSIVSNWGHRVPVVNDEYGYIGEPRDESEKGADGNPLRYSREKHRRTMWGIYAAGGYGSAGDKNSYSDGKPYIDANWHEASEWGDVKRLIDFYAAGKFEYWKMQPANSMVRSGRRVYVAGNADKEYIAYAAVGGEFALDLPPGTFQARRFDPRTGDDTRLASVSGPGVQPFSLPDAQDWVVYLRRESK